MKTSTFAEVDRIVQQWQRGAMDEHEMRATLCREHLTGRQYGVLYSRIYATMPATVREAAIRDAAATPSWD